MDRGSSVIVTELERELRSTVLTEYARKIPLLFNIILFCVVSLYCSCSHFSFLFCFLPSFFISFLICLYLAPLVGAPLIIISSYKNNNKTKTKKHC